MHGGGAGFGLSAWVLFAFCALFLLAGLVLLAQDFGQFGVVGDASGQVFVEIVNSRLRRLISFRNALIELEIVELSDLVAVAEIDILDDLEAFHFA